MSLYGLSSTGVVLVLALTLSGVPAASARDCLGDCDGDGKVTVDEILAGVSVALGSAELGSCPAFDLDDDFRVQVDEIIGAMDYALRGCPAPTPTAAATSTAVPSATATPLPEDPAERVIALAAPRVCYVGGYPGGWIEGATFHCDMPGHYGSVTLSGPHDGTPVADPNDPGVELIAGGVLRIQQRPHSQTNFGGIEQNWHWERDCWSLHGFVSDDTSYRLPPQPRESVRAVAEVAEQLGLFDQCTSSP